MSERAAARSPAASARLETSDAFPSRSSDLLRALSVALAFSAAMRASHSLAAPASCQSNKTLTPSDTTNAAMRPSVVFKVMKRAGKVTIRFS